MNCSKDIYKIAGCLSTISIFVILYGIYIQGYNIKYKGNRLVLIFPIMLAITLLLRLPTQLCIALDNDEGWYSVVGILIKLCSLIYLAYLTNKYK